MSFIGALDYEPGIYVREIARRSVGGHELLQQRNNIKVTVWHLILTLDIFNTAIYNFFFSQTLSESTHTQLKKNVYQNYRQFIDTAKEIAFLESEMYQLSHMITDQRNLLFELMQFSVSGEKVDSSDIEVTEEIPEEKNTVAKEDPSQALVWLLQNPL